MSPRKQEVLPAFEKAQQMIREANDNRQQHAKRPDSIFSVWHDGHRFRIGIISDQPGDRTVVTFESDAEQAAFILTSLYLWEERRGFTRADRDTIREIAAQKGIERFHPTRDIMGVHRPDYRCERLLEKGVLRKGHNYLVRLRTILDILGDAQDLGQRDYDHRERIRRMEYEREETKRLQKELDRLWKLRVEARRRLAQDGG